MDAQKQVDNLVELLDGYVEDVYKRQDADMAELADAHGSGPCGGNFMQVRLLLSAEKGLVKIDSSIFTSFFLFIFGRRRRSLYMKKGL